MSKRIFVALLSAFIVAGASSAFADNHDKKCGGDKHAAGDAKCSGDKKDHKCSGEKKEAKCSGEKAHDAHGDHKCGGHK